MPIYRLENVIQHYAWGSTQAIAGLIGVPNPTHEPQAELWMGTHHKGPSMVVDGQHREPLQELVDRQPAGILNRYVAERFDNSLPFLFKVLSAARPLSIQAHPNKREAIEGFLRENRDHKALDAPNRNYRDDNHKPEIICALTPFWGLNGFRTAASAAQLLAPVCPRQLDDALGMLRDQGEPGLRVFFESMMTLPAGDRSAALHEVIDKARKVAQRSPAYQWMIDLARVYPEDMGILSPVLLNLICLQPGQAMYLPAGQLHAYLEGTGIELMANSDNVLRGGLTPKHVDVPELLRVVRFVESPVAVIEPVPVGPGEAGYPCPAEEFALTVLHACEGKPYESSDRRSVEVLLCTSGDGRIDETGSAHKGLSVKKGDSFLVPANLDGYVLRGDLVVFKASVPLR